MHARRNYWLIGFLVGLAAVHGARSTRLLAWLWGDYDVSGPVLVEGLVADFMGQVSTPEPLVLGLAHFLLGGLIGSVVLAKPRYLLASCLAGLVIELSLLALLTPVTSLPNTNLHPLGAAAVGVYWMLLGAVSYLVANRSRNKLPLPSGGDPTVTIHRTALA